MHDRWDNRLVESLTRNLGLEYEIRYPYMPGEEDPQYGRWKSALEREIVKLGEGALLVGHSVGGASLVAALAEGMLARSLSDVAADIRQCAKS